MSHDGLLLRHVETDEQLVLPKALRPRVLHIAHYAKTSGHPGGQKLYEALRKDYYWSSLAVDAYSTVRNCVTCAKNRIKLRRHATQSKLFPALAPLEYVAIDILGPLVSTTKPRNNKFLLVIVDRFSK